MVHEQIRNCKRLTKLVKELVEVNLKVAKLGRKEECEAFEGVIDVGGPGQEIPLRFERRTLTGTEIL